MERTNDLVQLLSRMRREGLRLMSTSDEMYMSCACCRAPTTNPVAVPKTADELESWLVKNKAIAVSADGAYIEQKWVYCPGCAAKREEKFAFVNKYMAMNADEKSACAAEVFYWNHWPFAR
jgi:hypothetical protein